MSTTDRSARPKWRWKRLQARRVPWRKQRRGEVREHHPTPARAAGTGRDRPHLADGVLIEPGGPGYRSASLRHRAGVDDELGLDRWDGEPPTEAARSIPWVALMRSGNQMVNGSIASDICPKDRACASSSCRRAWSRGPPTGSHVTEPHGQRTPPGSCVQGDRQHTPAMLPGTVLSFDEVPFEFPCPDGHPVTTSLGQLQHERPSCDVCGRRIAVDPAAIDRLLAALGAAWGRFLTGAQRLCVVCLSPGAPLRERPYEVPGGLSGVVELPVCEADYANAIVNDRAALVNLRNYIIARHPGSGEPPVIRWTADGYREIRGPGAWREPE